MDMCKQMYAWMQHNMWKWEQESLLGGEEGLNVDHEHEL